MTASTHGGPLVSVVMIFRDAGRFIEEAIDSVIAQTWPHWELLLVDDGSVDTGREIAERYQRRMPDRVRVLTHPGRANRGMSASRNLALAVARGDLVAFLDADDVYVPERLELHIRQFERHPDAGAVQSRVEYWRSWAVAQTGRKRDTPGPLPPVRLEASIPPPTLLLIMLESLGATVPGICAITVRRPLLRSVGASEEAFRAHYEDQVLLSKLYLAANVVVTGETVARYRQHPSSSTGLHRIAGLRGPHPWHPGRADFLDWLESWLAGRGNGDALVRESLRRAKRKHFRESGPGRALGASLRRLVMCLVPLPLRGRLTDWWGDRKLAWSSWRAERASSRIAGRLSASSKTSDASRKREVG